MTNPRHRLWSPWLLIASGILALSGLWYARSAGPLRVDSPSGASEAYFPAAEADYRPAPEPSGLDLSALIDALATPGSALLAETRFAAADLTALDSRTQQVRLVDVTYAATALDSLSFTALDLGEGRVRIGDVAFSGPLTLGEGQEAATLSWEGLEWTGDYDLATQTYQRLDVSAEGLLLQDAAQSNSLAIAQLSTQTRLEDEGQTRESRTLASTFEAQSIELRLSLESTRLTYKVPEAKFSGTTRGLAAGQNPFATLNAQWRAVLDLPTPEPDEALRGEAGEFALTASASTLVLEDFSTVTLTLGDLQAQGTGTGYQTPGAGTADYDYELSALSYADPASGLRVTSGPLRASLRLQGLDYGAFLDADEGADRLADPAGGTYGQLGAYLLGDFLGTGHLQLSDLAITDPNAGLDLFMGAQSLSLELTQEDAKGGLSLALNVKDMRLPASDPAGLVGALLPADARLGLRLSQMDLASLAEILSTLPRSGSLEDEAAVAADLEAAGPTLLEWFLGSGALLQPSLSYTSPALAGRGDGELPIDGNSALGVSGSWTLRLDNFPDLQARITAAQQLGDAQDRAVAEALSGILLFLPAFASPDETGTLSLTLSFTDDGRPLVNDLLIPGF